MITAVDSNVVIDHLSASPEFGPPARRAFRRCLGDGAMIVSEVVWVEVATGAPTLEAVVDQFRDLGVAFHPMSEEGALAAAQAWRRYRREGGSRERLSPDFLIGGHAIVHADRILTRDSTFFRRWFPDLSVMDPTEG